MHRCVSNIGSPFFGLLRVALPLAGLNFFCTAPPVATIMLNLRLASFDAHDLYYCQFNAYVFVTCYTISMESVMLAGEAAIDTRLKAFNRR